MISGEEAAIHMVNTFFDYDLANRTNRATFAAQVTGKITADEDGYKKTCPGATCVRTGPTEEKSAWSWFGGGRFSMVAANSASEAGHDAAGRPSYLVPYAVYVIYADRKYQEMTSTCDGGGTSYLAGISYTCPACTRRKFDETSDNYNVWSTPKYDSSGATTVTPGQALVLPEYGEDHGPESDALTDLQKMIEETMRNEWKYE